MAVRRKIPDLGAGGVEQGWDAPTDISFQGFVPRDNPWANTTPPPAGTVVRGPGDFPTVQEPGATGGEGTRTPGGILEGFDTGKLADTSHETPKYVFGRLAQGAPSTTEGLGSLQLPEGWKVSGKDTIYVPGVGDVDVIRDVENGGAWQWMPPEAQGQGTIGGGVGGNDFIPLPGMGVDPGLAAKTGSYTPDNVGNYRGGTTTVNTDPMSQLTDQGYMDLISNYGATPFGSDLEATLRDLISSGGNFSQDVVNKRKESATELMNSGLRTLMNQGQGELAGRNLLSEPGIAQGPERTMVGQTMEHVAPAYARELRDIFTTEQENANNRVMGGLSLGTAMAQNQSNNTLNALSGATNRQNVVSNIALAALDRNMAWNQFLATFGLTRDQIKYEIQQGNLQTVLPYIQLFLQSAGISAGGYVGR